MNYQNPCFKHIIVLLLLIILNQYSDAQVAAVRVIIEKNADSIPVSLTVLKLPDSSIVTKSVAISDKTFSLNAHTNYLIKLSAAGILPTQQVVNVKDSVATVSFSLQVEKGRLDAVTVVGRKPLIRQEDDKTIVDAEPLAQASTNAYEIIEKTPGAVMIDGNIYLSSATPAMIQINGRNVRMSADELSSLLKNLPANSVVKIEILRTPSAKYDAESSGGIVNIVLKKGVKIGTNGSVNVEYTQGKYANYGTGFSLTRGIGKWKQSIAYQYNNRKSFQDLWSIRTYKDTSLSQDSYTRYRSQSHFINAGVDYEANKNLTFNYGVRLSLSSSHNNSENFNNTYADVLPQAKLTGSQALTDNRDKSFYLSNEIGSEWKMDSVGSKWTNNLSVVFSGGKGNQLFENNLFFPLLLPTLYNDGDLKTNRRSLEWGSDLELKKKWGFNFETGGKLSFNHQQNDNTFQYRIANNTVADTQKTRNIKYTEGVRSLYFQVARSFYRFNIKPGIRMENASIEGTQINPAGQAFSLNRTDFFPYVYVRHKLFKMMGFELNANAIFRKSIRRPGFAQLNPTIAYIDQYLYSKGNPQLKPQFTTNYEVNVLAGEYPLLAAGINNVKNIFTSVSYPDTNTRIMYNTFDNLGKSKEWYLRLMGGIPPGGKYFFYLAVEYSKTNYDGFYQSAPLKYSNGIWKIYSYHSLKVAKNTRFNAFFYYLRNGMYNFMELKPFGSTNFSVNQTLMNKKANLVLSYNDPFGMQKFEFKLNQGSAQANGVQKFDAKKFTIKFIYNFGIRPKQENDEMPATPQVGNGN